jgi:hypothetical protein
MQYGPDPRSFLNTRRTLYRNVPGFGHINACLRQGNRRGLLSAHHTQNLVASAHSNLCTSDQATIHSLSPYLSVSGHSLMDR